MLKLQYTQKFRDAWLKDPILKDWLVVVESIAGKEAKCKFCSKIVTSRYADLKAHGESKKHKTIAETAIGKPKICDHVVGTAVWGNMAKLGEVGELRDNIRKALVSSVRTLFNILFGTGQRLNRTKICDFEGFGWEVDSDECRQKIENLKRGYSVAELTAVCVLLGISYDGTAEDLATRLCTALTDFSALSAVAEVEDDEEEDIHTVANDTKVATGNRPASRQQIMPQTPVPNFSISFRDVEDSIRPFSGTDPAYPVEKFVADFEDLAMLLGWGDLQSYDLKTRLVREFAAKINSAELHQQLRERKMKKSESAYEYFLLMKELASRGNIEEEAVVHYIVEGIIDDSENKLMLYEASSYDQLRIKLEVYEKYKRSKNLKIAGSCRGEYQGVKEKPKTSAFAEDKKHLGPIPRKCFNCSLIGHVAAQCPKPKREKGSCYGCGKLDHVVANCPDRKRKERPIERSETARNHAMLVEKSGRDCEVAVDLELGDIAKNLLGVVDSAAPKANGQIERVNRVLTPMLAKLTVELNKWDKSLPQLELVLNNAANRSTGYSPSKLLFGVNQSYLEDDNIKTYLESIQKDSRDLLTIRAEASTKMELVGKYNKDQFDNRHKSPRKYQKSCDHVVGTAVWGNMAKLGEVGELGDNIRKAPVSSARTLFNILFGTGQRLNRTKICDFEGFVWEVDSDECQQKIENIKRGYSVAELTAVCVLLGISYDGTAEDLATRLCIALTDFSALNAVAEVEDDEEEDIHTVANDTEVATGNRPASRQQIMPQTPVPNFSISFRDVEDSIRPFSGTDPAYPVEKFVADFEDLAMLLGWGDLQSFLFAKKSLIGLAKMFVQGLHGVRTWYDLKTRLVREFAAKINSAELHQQLRERKMKKSESAYEYFLLMKELASRGNIEEEAVVHYIVEGILDDSENKLMLYEASSYDQLRIKLEVYEKFKRSKNLKIAGSSRGEYRGVKEKPKTSAFAEDKKHLGPIPRKCFNCSLIGHVAAQCPKPKREKGSCYGCGKLDHVIANCPDRKRKERPIERSETARNHAMLVEKSGRDCEVAVDLELGDIAKNLLGVVDSGSPISFIKSFLIPHNLRKPYLDTQCYTGINSSKLIILALYEGTVFVNSIKTSILFHVVPDETMKYDVALGRNFLFTSGLKISFDDNNMIIEQKPNERRESFDNELLLIDTTVFEGKELDCVINPELPRETLQKVENLVYEYNLPKVNDTQGTPTDFQTKIILRPDHTPFNFYPRRLSFYEKTQLQKILDDLQREGIIKESNSPYASPIVLVPKKSGELRLKKS
ncbi:hypothetical protein TcasGA2_TC032556 [Tribolium castaneum]|uniref:CCHC-type domain-containing protein n=1 Tax=Tribolium castaneum TaxID=7070 RepID=A0A139WKB5_TRICA|nr:hypothetical protein TcasGA2_TC032556 [Tribolium castaneum]